jgi:hypothetical protein
LGNIGIYDWWSVLLFAKIFDTGGGVMEKILDKIVEALKKSHLRLSCDMRDGRVNSSFNEDEVLEAISKAGFDIEIPKSRAWYDFSIGGIFVNVKISACKTADNCSSKEGLAYALTGLESVLNDFNNFHKVLVENLQTGYDYYFLVVNKNDCGDVFWTSLKRIKTLVPNGNNLPFQCNWGKNRDFAKRMEIEATNYLLQTYLDSWDKKIEGYPENIKQYLNKKD